MSEAFAFPPRRSDPNFALHFSDCAQLPPLDPWFVFRLWFFGIALGLILLRLISL